MVKLWRDENVGIKYFSSTDLSMFRRETSPIIRPARAASSRARIRDPARMQTTSPVSDSSIGVDDCDIILSQMETLLGGFQGAESKLARFLEDINIPPRLIDIIVDGEVNDEYIKNLELLSRKLKFVQGDPMVKSSRALKDVQLELDGLRPKAAAKEIDLPALIPHKYPYEVLF